MKHLTGKSLKVIARTFILILLAFSLAFGLWIVTDSAKEDKSVNEQVCYQQSSNRSISAVGGAALLMTIPLDKVEITEDVKEGLIEEQTKEEVYVQGWVTTNVRVRESASTESDVIDLYVYNTEIEYTDYNDEWVKIKYNNGFAYLSKELISNEKNPEIAETPVQDSVSTSVVTTDPQPAYSGTVLTRSSGVNYGPSGKETYYNLPMNGVIYYMQLLGYNYQYWVRSDGVKMYGDYIMLAANTNIRPKGIILQTSLGLGMVCDHCEAADGTLNQLDIAVTW